MRVLKFVFYGAFVLFVLNLLILDAYILLKAGSSPIEGILDQKNGGFSSISLPTNSVTEAPHTAGNSANLSCPVSCLSQIYTATASLSLAVPTRASFVLPTQMPTPTSIQPSSVSEFFIPFGDGTVSSEDWVDVDGAASYIDSSRYNKIKQALFEVSAHIPTGNEIAYIRLFNKTDQHPVWYSDVSLQGGTAQLLISQPVNLDAGNKLYQVQAKTSLGYPMVVDQARLHITTQQ